jgi:hypothetical protein
MDQAGIQSLFYLILIMIPLVYLPRFLQREIQSIFLLITHQPDVSTVLFSLLFFPGILLHETSHYLMAHLLGVKTGRFSLIPKKVGNGKLQLGYVETAATDFFRDALIGAAPLLAGGLFVGVIGITRLDLNTLWENLIFEQASSFRMIFKSISEQPDFWLWFYLVFTVSSTMMPSSSDRQAWLPLIIVIIIISGFVLLVGAGPWVFSKIDTIIQSAMDAIMIVFGITIFIHILLLPPAWLVRKLLSRISGYQVV